jgi:hypothetical protein
MSRIVQEKFQVNYPEVQEQGGPWVSDKSARVKKGLPGREGGHGTMDSAVFYNSLPPGSDGEDQELSDQRAMKLTMGGETDVSKDWNPEAVKSGFTRRTLRPTDDMYTREHNDAFYDEITVDGVTGFIERNNMLDRM